MVPDNADRAPRAIARADAVIADKSAHRLRGRCSMREAREHRARPRQHQHEARQRARRGADLELAEVSPVNLGLLAGQGRQLEEHLGLRRGVNRTDVPAHRRVAVEVAAAASSGPATSSSPSTVAFRSRTNASRSPRIIVVFGPTDASVRDAIHVGCRCQAAANSRSATSPLTCRRSSATWVQGAAPCMSNRSLRSPEADHCLTGSGASLPGFLEVPLAVPQPEQRISVLVAWDSKPSGLRWERNRAAIPQDRPARGLSIKRLLDK